MSRWVHGRDDRSHVSLRFKKPPFDAGSSAEQAAPSTSRQMRSCRAQPNPVRTRRLHMLTSRPLRVSIVCYSIGRRPPVPVLLSSSREREPRPVPWWCELPNSWPGRTKAPSPHPCARNSKSQHPSGAFAIFRNQNEEWRQPGTEAMEQA